MLLYILFFLLFFSYFADFSTISNDTCNTQQYDMTVYKGFDYMKHQSVVITGLARNIATKIPFLMEKLYKLTSYFKQYKIIFLENDSTDMTREMLLMYAKTDPNVIVLGCGVNADSCKLNLKRHDSFQFGIDRIGKMAYLRNLYMDYIKRHYRGYDYCMMIDYDLLGSFYLDGVANSFYNFFINNRTDAIGANSINIFIKSYYDPFALVEEGQSIEYKDLKSKIAHDFYIMSKYKVKKCDPLVKVRSCFAGLVIYRMKSILDKKYDYSKNAIACEHAYFNDGLDIYINPSMMMNVLMN